MSEHPQGRAGAPQLTPQGTEPEAVATGDRRDEVRYERRANQQLRMRATFPPDAPMPAEMVPRDAAPAPPDSKPDVAELPDVPSAWDARPPEDEANPSGRSEP